MTKKIHIITYVLSDFMASVIAWTIFYCLHKISVGDEIVLKPKFFYGLFLLPVGWLVLYHLLGTYKNIYYKSRLLELLSTFTVTFIGSIILFFIYLFYSSAKNNVLYYDEFFTLFMLQFAITYFFRLIILSKAHRQLQEEKVWFNTLIVGCGSTGGGSL